MLPRRSWPTKKLAHPQDELLGPPPGVPVVLGCQFFLPQCLCGFMGLWPSQAGYCRAEGDRSAAEHSSRGTESPPTVVAKGHPLAQFAKWCLQVSVLVSLNVNMALLKLMLPHLIYFDLPYRCVQVQTVQVVRTSSVKKCTFYGQGWTSGSMPTKPRTLRPPGR